MSDFYTGSEGIDQPLVGFALLPMEDQLDFSNISPISSQSNSVFPNLTMSNFNAGGGGIDQPLVEFALPLMVDQLDLNNLSSLSSQPILTSSGNTMSDFNAGCGGSDQSLMDAPLPSTADELDIMDPDFTFDLPEEWSHLPQLLDDLTVGPPPASSKQTRNGKMLELKRKTRKQPNYGRGGKPRTSVKKSSGLDLHSTMLSTTSSSIQDQRTQHRRQNSTPAIFEAGKVQPLPMPTYRQSQHQRGHSFDQATIQDFRPLLQDQMMTITNTGYQPMEQQPYMQVAQQHSMAQPGYIQDPTNQQDYFNQQHTSIPTIDCNFSPQPYQLMGEVRPQSSPQNNCIQPSSPIKDNDEREKARKEIEERIQEFNRKFGNDGQCEMPKTPPGRVLLPTPPPTVQKSNNFSLDTAPMPNFTATTDLSLATTNEDPSMTLLLPGGDDGYQSSYHSSPGDSTSLTLSPVAQSSPIMPTLFEESTTSSFPQLTFPNHTSLLASSSQTALDLGICLSPSHAPVSPRTALVQDPMLNASIEETGITPEEVQAFIGEQDEDGKWTCLYEGCNRKFGRKENVKSHVQTHLGDRQFKCNECLKCFVRQHDLRRHSMIHRGDRPYECLCTSGFGRHDALTRHRMRGKCIGAFPEAIKREQARKEASKRGRPRKIRPELQQRAAKANKARELDNLADLEADYPSSSSISGASGSSSHPTTPESDFELNPYIDLGGMDNEFQLLTAPMQETPPTSPIGVSPDMLTLSSPPAMSEEEELRMYLVDFHEQNP
ncbi:MAG: hypothetical protein M1820_008084 [Bogoriella megaspora]|nr:MAG: hypothetical protein M1820_008084 [Bogoriella megaspora]